MASRYMSQLNSNIQQELTSHMLAIVVQMPGRGHPPKQTWRTLSDAGLIAHDMHLGRGHTYIRDEPSETL